MNKIIINLKEITKEDVIQVFNKLLDLYKNNQISLNVPDSKSKYPEHIISFISEIFSFVHLLYEDILFNMGFKNPISLIDPNYDKLNRQGFDHLFVDLELGELIIGETKSSIKDDFETNYKTNIKEAKRSLKGNEKKSIKKQTLIKIDKEAKNNSFFWNVPFVDNSKIKMSNKAIDNFRNALSSILLIMDKEEKKVNFNDYNNVSLLMTLWNGTLKDNSFFTKENIEGHFTNKIIKKMYSKTFAYILGSNLLLEEYIVLYDYFYENFSVNYKLWLQQNFSETAEKI